MTKKAQSNPAKPQKPIEGGLSIAPPAATSGAPNSTPDAADKPLRQSSAPVCPYCKDDKGEPHVVCKAQGSSFYFTRYKCPTPGCPFRAQVPRPKMNERIQAAKDAETDFSARPKAGE